MLAYSELPHRVDESLEDPQNTRRSRNCSNKVKKHHCVLHRFFIAFAF